MTNLLFAGHEALIPPATKTFLEERGYRLTVNGDFGKVMATILDEPPDLLLVAKEFGFNQVADLIKAAKACLQKANIPILLMIAESEIPALDWNLFPVDDLIVLPFFPEMLLARIQLAQSRTLRVFDNNPLSKLPGNTSILRAIQQRLDSGAKAAVCYVDIDNFKPYNDRYGFSQGDDIIVMVARIIVNVVEERAREESFVGHVGGDDFVFIIREEKINQVCERILANFEVVRNMFLSPEDLKAGGYTEKDRQGRQTSFELLSLSIAVLPIGHGKFKHFGEVSAAASQIKHQVKKMRGNNFLVDQRKGYTPFSNDPES